MVRVKRAAAGHGLVISQESSSLAASGEVFEGIKTQCSRGGLLPYSRDANSLTGIFQDNEAVFIGHVADGGLVGQSAIQVYREDDLGSGSNGGLDFLGVEIMSVGLDIHQDRHAPQAQDRILRGREAVGWHNNLIARLQIEGEESDHQGLGATGTQKHVLNPQKLTQTRLQGFNFITINARSGPDRFGDRCDANLFRLVTHHPLIRLKGKLLRGFARRKEGGGHGL